MAKYDLRDEAIVGLEPGEIVQAPVDEAAGRSSWGHPWVRMRQRGDIAFNEVGAVLDLAWSLNGHVDRRLGTVHLTAKVTSVTPERRVQMDYSGDLAGTAVWAFDRRTRDTPGSPPVGRRIRTAFWCVCSVRSQACREPTPG